MMCKRLCFHLKNKFELSPQIHFGVFQTQINQSASRLSLRSFEVKRSLCHHFVSCCPSTCGWIPSRKPPTRVFNWESYWIYQLPKRFLTQLFSLQCSVSLNTHASSVAKELLMSFLLEHTIHPRNAKRNTWIMDFFSLPFFYYEMNILCFKLLTRWTNWFFFLLKYYTTN